MKPILQALLSLVVLNSAAALLEMRYDKILAKQFDIDGRDSDENALLHGKQMDIRTFVILLITVYAIQVNKVHLYSFPIGVLLSAVIYWIVFDIVVNKFWLKKPLFYTGSTSGMDRK